MTQHYLLSEAPGHKCSNPQIWFVDNKNKLNMLIKTHITKMESYSILLIHYGIIIYWQNLKIFYKMKTKGDIVIKNTTVTKESEFT